MRTGIGIATVIAVWSCAVTTGWPQETTISIGVSSYNQTEAGLKYLVEDLPAGALKKQWPNLQGVLSSFMQGADPAKPIQVDLILGKEAGRYLAVIPVVKFEGRGGFVQNVESFGFNVSKADANGIHTIEQQRAQPRRPGGKKPAAPAGPPPKPFFMKHVFGYAFFAAEKSALQGKLVDPAPSMTKLLQGGADLVALLENDTATMDAKRKSFQELRKQWEAAISFSRGESQAEFELRKLSLNQNLNEAERFLIESSQLSMEWTTDSVKERGVGSLSLAGLADTDLFQSIALLNTKPSYFANVTFGEKAALQLRVNFPIDDLRSRHASELYPVLLPVMQEQMDDRPNLNAAGKAKAKVALEKFFGMLTAAIPLKVLDTIIDVHATPDGKNGLLCGIRSADGNKATEILAMFPDIRSGWKFEPKVAEHGGVAIHKLHMAPHRMDEFNALFGGEPVMYIGTTQDAVWGATGEGSLDRLKAAIDQAAKPASEAIAADFLTLEMRFEPWVKMLDLLRSKEPPSTTADEAERELAKQRDKIRKYALDTFADCDSVLTAKLTKQGEVVTGSVDVSRCLLKFVGTLIADFTAENLQ
ncbi:hypothetical protein GC163_02585 [bacterium]|nr:hypothetical protein [bacterium]